MKRVVLGMIGSGFASELHLNALRRVSGVEVDVKAVAGSRQKEQLSLFAVRHGVRDIYADYRELLSDGEIDVADICTPPALHESIAIEALEAGKHVIVEKPLTGYFYEDAQPGRAVSGAHMYGRVLEKLGRVRAAAERSGKLFMYAENWVYMPVVQKAAELLSARKNKILYMHGEESHSGSHAAHAANWRFSGGGALIRQGCHPISAMLYLKGVEAASRGETTAIKSVTCETGFTAACLTDAEKRYIVSRPVDVEDIADLIMTFSDGSKAHVVSADMLVGGKKNCLDVCTNDAVYRCKTNPNDAMTVFHADEGGLEDVHFTEKLGTKQGWQYIAVEDDVMRGYLAELQDFMECAATGRQPLSGIDIAYDTARVIYAAYRSAEEGRRIAL